MSELKVRAIIQQMEERMMSPLNMQDSVDFFYLLLADEDLAFDHFIC